MTPVVANLVLAGSSIETGLVSALVDVGVTSLPLPAGITVAGPVIDLVPAPTSVTAGILTINTIIFIDIFSFLVLF